MTNMEFYRSEIEHIMAQGNDIAVSKNGQLMGCWADVKCEECICYPSGACNMTIIKWLMAEHKEEPTLTQREKHFVEFAETGFLTRDIDGKAAWWLTEPTKDELQWRGAKKRYLSGFTGADTLFSFITREDDEPWSVEDLRKLEVKE